MSGIFKLIGIVTVIYLAFVTGAAQAAMLITAGLLATVATL